MSQRIGYSRKNAKLPFREEETSSMGGSLITRTYR
jgi:hypothetical protein